MKPSSLVCISVLLALLATDSLSGHIVKRDITWNGNWALGCDFYGNDLTSAQIRGEDCGGRCAQTSGCTHFTWTTYNGGTCWMKQGSVSKSNARSTNDQSMVCGIVGGSNPQPSGIVWNGNWALGCDFYGNDLTSAQIRGEDCGGRCAQTSGCTHFTWTTYNGGTCWMKQGSVSKSNARSTNDQSMVCGIVGGPSPPPTGGVSGRTTRYWDCCKPSCGWSGKVSGSSAYVKSCSKNGYAAHGDPNVASGCGGGDAYTCNNQKPWAVNDQLAYGFAAAHIPGLSEQDRCCACYKLVFTSGPIAGKTMIVQVTNSGSDVGEHQFDLQIPGGGVGIYNACSRQWGAPGDGWGQRYGGVGSRQECYNVPGEIRDGCLFRFDWFKGADNPTMTYSKVNCPAELTAITGCSR